MTKILYIPTGEFINNSLDDTTYTIEFSQFDSAEKLPENYIKNIVFELNNNEDMYTSWKEINQIVLPVSEAEFEVIYD